MGENVRAIRVEVGGDAFAIFELGGADLSAAEIAVVQAAAAGKKNREIAVGRGTSERTVAHQLRSAYRKLGVGSRAELAARQAVKRAVSARRGDPIALIEAAYRTDPDVMEWMTGIVESAGDVLQAELGVTAYLFDVSRAHGLRVGELVGVGCPGGWREAFGALFRGAPNVSPELLQKLRIPISVASEVMGGPMASAMPSGTERLEALGVRDFLRLVAEAPGGFGCVLNAPLSRTGSVSAYDTDLLERVLSHVSAGFRLRRALANADAKQTLESLATAVLDPGGRVVHAVGDARAKSAREALSEGAKAVDRARGPLRREDPRAAVDLWQGLVRGRWSLVEQMDRDGRRFLLAHERAPVKERAPELSDREQEVASYAALGHSNKLIAYELGLHESAVAMRLSRAFKKLRVRSRVELISALDALREPVQSGAP